MPTILLNYYQYAAIFSLILTAFINSLLIILTSCYIKQKFGTYKYLIIIFSIFSLSYDISGYLISPMVHSFDDGFVYFTLTQSTFIPQTMIRNFLAFSGSIFLFSTAMLSVMFIHRYFSIVKPGQLFYFQGKRLTLWLSYSSVFGVVFHILALNLGDIDDFTKGYANQGFIESYGFGIDDIAAFSFLVFDEDKKYRWKGMILTMFVLFTMIFQNCLIIVCGFKIRAKLYNQNCTYSPALLSLHKQFFKTLVLQVTIPTVFIFLPVFMIYCAPFIGLKLSVSSTNAFCLFYLYPAIDSCIVMYVISDYKTALIEKNTMRKSSKEMNSRRVSLPVALAIPQQFPSRLSPPSPASPASPATRRSLPTSPICRRSLPSTPRTISPRRLTNLLPDVDEHFPSTSSSSENSPRRVKKKRPPPRYQYSLQTALKRADSQAESEEKPEGSLRSFDIKNGQVVDNGYKNVGQPNYNKDRRATCPEVYLFPDTGSKPMRHVVLRIYGFKGTGKKSLLNSLNQYATRLVTRYNNDPCDEDESCSKIITFLLNNEPIELEILLESTLENSPFASCLTMYAIMYNVDSKEAFLDATCLLERLIHRKIAANPSNIILVGNKVDLKRNTVVTKIEGACVAKLHKCNFIEISATLSMNMSELWNIILKQVQTPPQSSTNTTSSHQNATSSSLASTWMTRIFSRGRQFAHSAEQIVSKIL